MRRKSLQFYYLYFANHFICSLFWARNEQMKFVCLEINFSAKKVSCKSVIRRHVYNEELSPPQAGRPAPRSTTRRKLTPRALHQRVTSTKAPLLHPLSGDGPRGTRDPPPGWCAPLPLEKWLSSSHSSQWSKSKATFGFCSTEQFALSERIQHTQAVKTGRSSRPLTLRLSKLCQGSLLSFARVITGSSFLITHVQSSFIMLACSSKSAK